MVAPAEATMNISADVPVAPLKEISYRIASTQYERRAAFNLVYEAYVETGLIEPNEFEMRVTPYHLLPTTNVFIAVYQDEIIGTVSLIGDGELGLPMDCIYDREVNGLRDRGYSLGEVSCLAHRRQQVKQTLPLFVQMTRLMAQHSRQNGMDQFLIAVHPRHAQFYMRFMGFEQIGSQKSFPSVRNNPAVACALNFPRIDVERPACYSQFFGTAIPMEDLHSTPLNALEVEEFADAALEGGLTIPSLMC